MGFRKRAPVWGGGLSNNFSQNGFSAFKLVQTEQGAAQVIQVNGFAVEMSNLTDDGQGFLVEIDSGLVIAAQPGAFPQVAPHGPSIAAVPQFQAQGQALLEVAVGFLEMAQVKVGDAIELKAGHHPAPVAIFGMELERLLSQVQNARSIAQLVKGPAFEIERLDPLLEAGFACFARQRFSPLGDLDRSPILGAAFDQKGHAVPGAGLCHAITQRFGQQAHVGVSLQALDVSGLGPQGLAQTLVPLQTFELEFPRFRRLGRQ